MKFLLKTILSASIVFFLGAACSKPDPTKEPSPEPNPEPTPEDVEYVVDVSEIGTVTVNVHIKVKDEKKGYFSDVLSENDFKQAQKHGFDDYLNYVISTIITEQGKTRDQAVKDITSYGNDDYILTTLKPDSKYYAVAVGIDASGKSTTDVYSKEFKTADVESSDNTFEISVSDISEMEAKVSIKTGNDDTYFMDVVPSGIREELGTDWDIRHYLIESHLAAGDLEDFIIKGSAEMLYEGLKPGWKYEVVVFGCKDGFANTEAAIESFTAVAGEDDPSLCEFEFDCTLNVNEPSVFAFYPSDPMAVYICDAMFEEDYQMILESLGGDAAKAGEMILEEMIFMYGSDFGTRAETLNLISEVGPYEYNSDVEPGKDYRMWAVCVDQDGKPVGEFIVSEVFKSPDAVVSSATVSIKNYPWYDGDELYKLDPNTFKGAKGNAVVMLQVEPSKDAADWWAWVFYEDLREYSDKTVINNLTKYGMPEMNKFTDGYIVAYWGENTICAVAKDADGNFGAPVRQYVNLTKEGATPVEQLQSFRQLSVFPMMTSVNKSAEISYRSAGKRVLK